MEINNIMGAIMGSMWKLMGIIHGFQWGGAGGGGGLDKPWIRNDDHFQKERWISGCSLKVWESDLTWIFEWGLGGKRLNKGLNDKPWISLEQARNSKLFCIPLPSKWPLRTPDPQNRQNWWNMVITHRKHCKNPNFFFLIVVLGCGSNHPLLWISNG